jgi:hypothetical protein
MSLSETKYFAVKLFTRHVFDTPQCMSNPYLPVHTEAQGFLALLSELQARRAGA